MFLLNWLDYKYGISEFTKKMYSTDGLYFCQVHVSLCQKILSILF